jgi:hypothetical protein
MNMPIKLLVSSFLFFLFFVQCNNTVNQKKTNIYLGTPAWIINKISQSDSTLNIRQIESPDFKNKSGTYKWVLEFYDNTPSAGTT